MSKIAEITTQITTQEDIDNAQIIYDEMLDLFISSNSDGGKNLAPALKYLCLRIARLERIIKGNQQ